MTKISDRKVPNMLVGLSDDNPEYGLPDSIRLLPHMQDIQPGQHFTFAQAANDLRLLYLNANRTEPRYRQDRIAIRLALEALEATAYELWIARNQLAILSVL